MKKLLAIAMGLVFVFALCACGKSSSSETKANGFTGNWEMESYKSAESQAADHTIVVKMEILEDKSFSYIETETDAQGNSLKTVVSGTYTDSNDTATFNYTHISITNSKLAIDSLSRT